MTLVDLIANLPKDEYIKFTVEADGDSDIVCMCHFRKPPDDGWPTKAAYFHHPVGSPTEQVTEFPWKHADSVLYGVSTDQNNLAEFEQDCIHALNAYIASR